MKARHAAAFRLGECGKKCEKVDGYKELQQNPVLVTLFGACCLCNKSLE